MSSNQRSRFPIQSDWETVWNKIEEWRSKNIAPVDVVGCSKLADVHSDQKTFRYQTLLSLMLSSQTKDQLTALAMENLKKSRFGCTVDGVLNSSEKEIDSLISCVGFHKRKAGYIMGTTRILQEEYDGDVPDSMSKLMDLPGVGPKMASLTLLSAFGKAEAIGVDTHVHRISKRLGWAKDRSKIVIPPGKKRKKHQRDIPENTREDLESWLPKEKWSEINKLLVGFGQTQCTAVKPLCESCPVKDGCPSAFQHLRRKKPQIKSPISKRRKREP